MSGILQSNLIKFLLFAFILFGIYWVVNQQNESLMDVFLVIKQTILSKNWWKIVLIIFLTPLNWAFEAKKWQFVASKIEKLSFWNAYKGILAGLSLGFTTPVTIGDFAGRILMMKTEKRTEAIGAIMLGNGMQLFASLSYGVLAYWFFIFRFNLGILHYVFAVLVSIFIIWGLIMMVRGINFGRILKIIPAKIQPYLAVIQTYSTQDLFKTYFIASIRYFIIVIQFTIAFEAFQINLSIFDIINGVILILFAKTVVPMINFASDLGVREAASLYYFSFFSIKASIVTGATMLIWIFNLLLPIIVGSLMIWQLKLSVKK